MSIELKTKFGSIKKHLDNYTASCIYIPEIATKFNSKLKQEFEKYDLKPVFVGEYFVDPQNPSQTRIFCHQGTDACSPIPITRGIIGRAIRTGQDQYIPDITKDSEHVQCDPNMEGSELVLITWSDPYKIIEFAGHSIPLGVLDLDLNVKNALLYEDISTLREIWDVYGKKIFPGPPTFVPTAELIAASRYSRHKSAV